MLTIETGSQKREEIVVPILNIACTFNVLSFMVTYKVQLHAKVLAYTSVAPVLFGFHRAAVQDHLLCLYEPC